MFIIRLIIHIIKTKCFNNTIIMGKFERKLPQSKWSLFSHKFPSSSYFHKIFGMHLQKGLAYLFFEKFLPSLLCFWNYSNGQIISLIGAQAHLQTQPLGAEWYKVLKIIHCRIYPTKQIEEEVKLQSYILSFLYCFFSLESNTGKRLWRSPWNYRELLELFLECQFRTSITFWCIFLG